jgi:pimeloyl-ACP methyl ester carboxylesterase
VILLAMIAVASQLQQPQLEQPKRIVLHDAGQPALSVRHVPGPGASVVYVHGSTFPSALSIDYRIDGKSWADDLRARGFDVWSFDFPGYGASDRQPEMSKPTSTSIPGRAAEAADQIERVVRYIRSQMQGRKVSIIAHSWGTIPAALFAGRYPDWVARLVLFAPVAQREAQRQGPNSPVLLVSAADQWNAFQAGLPNGTPSLISQSHFDQWAATYLSTDAAASTRSPPSVAVPSGPDADVAAAWTGHLPYDPALIRAPTLIVRGEWDPIARDADAAWLVAAMTHVPGGATDLKLPRGAHRMLLEDNRQALFDAVGRFLMKDEK